MGEKIAKLGIKRDNDMMYYIKSGDVWATPRKKPGQPKGKAAKVAAAGVEMDYSKYLYYLDGDGDVARKERQVGGSKRKTAKRARRPRRPRRPPAKKAAAKKAPAKKAAGARRAAARRASASSARASLASRLARRAEGSSAAVTQTGPSGAFGRSRSSAANRRPRLAPAVAIAGHLR